MGKDVSREYALENDLRTIRTICQQALGEAPFEKGSGAVAVAHTPSVGVTSAPEPAYKYKNRYEFAETALKNAGVDLGCGVCASVAFTGSAVGQHTCRQSKLHATVEKLHKKWLDRDSLVVAADFRSLLELLK